MIAYIAKETFYPPWDPTNEIITLDCMLCPDIIGGMPTPEDWSYIVYHEAPAGTFFRDLDYLLSRIEAATEFQVLAVLREPTLEAVQSFADKRFEFKGYDLVEVDGGISTLTNCGGFFDLAFSDDDLSPWGLVPDQESAYRIRDLLRKHYPDEHHADCHVWAIWRMERLSDYFRRSPLAGAELELDRDNSPIRGDVDLEHPPAG
jgi:hypothetical protein